MLSYILLMDDGEAANKASEFLNNVVSPILGAIASIENVDYNPMCYVLVDSSNDIPCTVVAQDVGYAFLDPDKDNGYVQYTSKFINYDHTYLCDPTGLVINAITAGDELMSWGSRRKVVSTYSQVPKHHFFIFLIFISVMDKFFSFSIP